MVMYVAFLLFPEISNDWGVGGFVIKTTESCLNPVIFSIFALLLTQASGI